ncbi:MAG: ABC transporter substrate-binding protein [Acidimicrobiia bacterium]
MRTRRSRIVASVFLALMLSFMVACGSSGSREDLGLNAQSSTSTSGSAEDVGSNEFEAMPVRGGVLTIAEISDGDTLDPYASAYANVHQRVGLAASRLLKPDTTGEYGFGEAPLGPDLAEAWDISDDLLTYTFKLREDVFWHDIAPVNGRQFTSDDVVASFEKIQADGVQASMLAHVTEIVAPDDFTVVLTLDRPFAPLLSYMGNHQMWIMPREGIEGLYDMSKVLIGTGPFIMTKWDRDVQTVYEANDNYYDKDLPYLDKIVMPVIPEQSARIAAYRSGEIDMIASLTPQERELIMASVPGSYVVEDIGTSPVMMYVNMGRKPFDDVRVRRAISLAVDRVGLGETIFGEGLLSGPVNSHLARFALSQDELSELIPYDPELARRLLAEAGYPDGFESSLMVSSGYGPAYVTAAEWVVADLGDVGIKMNIDVVDQATYSTRRPEVNYDMGVGPSTPFQEPDEWLRSQYHTGGDRNWWNIDDATLDEMLDEQARTVDEDQRIKLVQDIQRYILTDVVNPSHLWVANTATIIQPRIKNFAPQPEYGRGYLAYLWIENS